MKRNLNKVSLFAMIAIAIGTLTYVGCDDIKKDIASVNPDTKQFTGTVLGKIFDRCTGAPIAGVKVSMAGKSAVTTNSNGEFVFRDVPITTDGTYTNGYNTFWDSYEVLMDFTGYNKNKADSLKYPDYKLDEVDVIFTDLHDGDNYGSGSDGNPNESGSGADTPVDGIVSSMTNLEIGRLNTTISGEIVDALSYDVVANAIVYLKQTNSVGNTTVVKQTTTDNSGKYTFARVENGASFTVEAMNDTRTLSGSVGVNLTCGQDALLSSQVTAQRLLLSFTDNVAPFVTAINIQNNEDVDLAAKSSIVYTFSEPIKQTAYTDASLPKGHGTIVDDITFSFTGLKKADAAIQFTASWNAPTFDQLTITPTGMTGASRYSISYAAGMAAKLTDAKGNALANAGTAIVGDFLNTESLAFTTKGLADKPAKPVLTKDPTTPLVQWNGGSVKLEWSASEATVKIKYFDIYKKIGDGPFDRIATNVRSTDTTLTIGANDLNSGGNNPRYAQSVQFMVQAISVNLVVGDASDPVSVIDDTRPTVVTATLFNATNPTQDSIVVQFSEPLNEVQAETAANYSISGGGNNVRSVVYRGFNAVGDYRVSFIVDKGSVIATEVLTVTGINDLQGNAIDPNANSFTF
ncbi:hypothetical protein HUU42_01390 [bacterium]|nr:hypothetical protein [bacterium]